MNEEAGPAVSKKCYWPLAQLMLCRLREFYRQPEAVFWVYGFPLLMILALGGWQTAVQGVSGADILLGSLLVSAACMAALCLGVVADLGRSSHE